MRLSNLGLSKSRRREFLWLGGQEGEFQGAEKDSCVCLVTAKAFLNGSPGGPGVISSCLAKKQPISNTEFYRGNKGRWVEEPRFCKISHNCASMTLSLKPKAETRNLHYHHYLSYPCFVLHWLYFSIISGKVYCETFLLQLALQNTRNVLP